MSTSEEHPSRYLALILGAVMLAFGLLKLVSPFRDWFAVQTSASGLPPFSYPLGIASEVLDGALFLVPWIARDRLRNRRRIVWNLASLWLIGIMLVATYVHLHPAVSAAVLPLKVKPPVIPLAMLAVATMNIYLLRREPTKSRGGLDQTAAAGDANRKSHLVMASMTRPSASNSGRDPDELRGGSNRP